jgi:hypothetical protein
VSSVAPVAVPIVIAVLAYPLMLMLVGVQIEAAVGITTAMVFVAVEAVRRIIAVARGGSDGAQPPATGPDSDDR